MPHEARAFWLRLSGQGEIRSDARCPSPGRVRSAYARSTPASAAVPRRWCFAAAYRRASMRDARTVPGRRVPGSGEVRLPERRRCRGWVRGAARAHRLLPLSASDRIRRPRRRGRFPVPDDVPPARAVLAAPWRPRSTPCGTRHRWIGDRIAVVGAGMVGCAVARCARPTPRRAGSSSSTSNPPAPTWRVPSASSSRCRSRPQASAIWSFTPARRPPGSSAVSNSLPRRARSSNSAGTETETSRSGWANHSTPAG